LSGTFATVDAGGLPVTLEYGATGLTLISWLEAAGWVEDTQTTPLFLDINLLQIVVTAGNISVTSAGSGGADSSSETGAIFAETSASWTGKERHHKRSLRQCRIGE
jgi:hypothetical protein